MSPSKILFQLTGSIACFKACTVISQLVQLGHEVQVVASKAALRFVGEATLEGLTGKAVLTDLYAKGAAMEHIYQAFECDLAILCPASANTINQLAAGLAPNLIGALYLAFKPGRPYLIVPAMNSHMWDHPTVQDSLKKLQERGATTLSTQEGRLACGAYGYGKMLEPEAILEAIENTLCHKKKKILITAGGTEEPIDEVRVLGNKSTGKTGAFLAAYFCSQGHEVTLLRAQSATPAPASARQIPFTTSLDLCNQLKTFLSEESYDLVIHAAAVSDFVVESAKGKISSKEPLTLQLKPAPKILPQIKGFSKNPRLQLVGFKLTSGASEQQIAGYCQGLFDYGADMVIHNEVHQVQEHTHLTCLHLPCGDKYRCGTKEELAKTLKGALLP